MVVQRAVMNFSGFFLAAGTIVSREFGHAKDIHSGELGGVHSNMIEEEWVAASFDDGCFTESLTTIVRGRFLLVAVLQVWNL